MRSRAVGLLIASAATASAAPILQFDGSGLLIGATGVDVGGTLYDVTFVDSTCAATFNGCDSNSDFDFTTQASATVAAQALLDQVFVGAYDTTPSLTFGCDGPANVVGNCFAFIPYTLNSFGAAVVGAENEIAEPADMVTFGFTYGTSFNFSTCAACVLADFTPSATPVPEPATLLLLGSGLAGVVARARRGKQRVQ